MYRKGHMEGWLGEALRACPEELQPRFAISTKAAPDERALVRPLPRPSPSPLRRPSRESRCWQVDDGGTSLSTESVLRQASLSVASVQLGRPFDIYYLHSVDTATPIEETLRAVDQLYREGVFLRFGLSNYTAW